jgi:short-subunit dehydrogenase
MKKAIVIGASSGIGKELALLLANQGYQVGITGRRTALLEELKLHHPDRFVVSTFDATDTSTAPQHVQKLEADLGGLDLLIYSSGTGELNFALDFELEKPTIDTNVAGFTAITDWAFNYFKKQGGHIAVISSIAGIRGSRFAPAYNASKAYQISYLEALRQKAKHDKHPITITDVRPGFVKTAMAKGKGQFWVASVEKASSQILHALNRKKSVVYITKRWVIIAWLLKFMPRWLYERM